GDQKKVVGYLENEACNLSDVDYDTGRGLFAGPAILEIENDVNPIAYYTDSNNQFWLYWIPRDWEWSPGERRIIVRPQDDWIRPHFSQETDMPSQLLAIDVDLSG